MLAVESLAVGTFQSNCHIVYNTRTREAIIVDPGEEAAAILAAVKSLGVRVTAIWLTHAHIDHIGAVPAVRRATSVPVWIHEIEADWMTDPVKNLGAWLGLMQGFEPADRFWKGGETVQALGTTWTIHHTPGHSPGHVAYLCTENAMAFSGDLIMEGSIGRTDFPGCDARAMVASLRHVLTWHDSTRLYVGHGPDTTVGDERRTNYVLASFLE